MLQSTPRRLLLRPSVLPSTCRLTSVRAFTTTLSRQSSGDTNLSSAGPGSPQRDSFKKRETAAEESWIHKAELEKLKVLKKRNIVEPAVFEKLRQNVEMLRNEASEKGYDIESGKIEELKAEIKGLEHAYRGIEEHLDNLINNRKK